MSAKDHMIHIADGRFDWSLTPQADMAELVISDMKRKLGPQMLLPGRDGARARLAVACNEAVQRVMARELDGGLPVSEVTDVTLQMLGDIVAGLAMRYVHDRTPGERHQLAQMMCNRLVGRVAHVVETIDELGPDQISAVAAPRPRDPGRA